MIELEGLPFVLIRHNIHRIAETAEQTGRKVPPPRRCRAGRRVLCRGKNYAARRMERLWNAREDVERIVFPSGGVLCADGHFRGPMRLAVHLQRLVQLVESERRVDRKAKPAKIVAGDRSK